MGSGVKRGLLAALALILLQPVAAQDLTAGRLLVASRDVRDANFAETVVLLVRFSRASAMGLVVNRPTNIPVSAALKGVEQAAGREEPVYIGGPVGRAGALALLVSRTAPPKATRVLEGLYLISTREDLVRALEAGASDDSLRVYLGYAGWSAGQLEAEIAHGSWHVVQGTVGVVFDPYPGSLWRRLIPGVEPKLARTPPAAGHTR